MGNFIKYKLKSTSQSPTQALRRKNSVQKLREFLKFKSVSSNHTVHVYETQINEINLDVNKLKMRLQRQETNLGDISHDINILHKRLDVICLFVGLRNNRRSCSSSMCIDHIKDRSPSQYNRRIQIDPPTVNNHLSVDVV